MYFLELFVRPLVAWKIHEASLRPLKKAPCMVAGYCLVVASPAKNNLFHTLSARIS